MSDLLYLIAKQRQDGIDYYKKQQELQTRRRIKAEFEEVKAEIKEWYWQSDKQELAKDPCIVDAMIDLFIRTINKHIKELENEENYN